jgi:Tol biopolymer transport system component
VFVGELLLFRKLLLANHGLLLPTLLAAVFGSAHALPEMSGAAAVAEREEAAKEAPLMDRVRQLTFAGRRAGEGYFSPDGGKLVFQSEREPGNPFYQIYTLDLRTGDTRRVSSGTGKTTCAWFLPDGSVIYSSTHEDPESASKQQAELERRAKGEEDRYTWDYDPNYEIYKVGPSGESPVRLTNAMGYDAEASASPDGRHIVFSSNREAYARPLSDRERQAFERDPAYFADLYLMDADGSNPRRLTNVEGYDGGPFFSPDGMRITWRRFSKDGSKAEIYTMAANGSDVRQLTRLDAMSWAPYYHPSGDYLIFATNKHGFDNFELYLVDAQGQHEPVRVTHTSGFDGLPVFSPDGKTLAWTSTRTPDKTAQIFLAAWDDAEARRRLGLPATAEAPASEPAADCAPSAETTGAITAGDMARHVTTLASEEMEGRLTGTEGEKKATEYAAEVFRRRGLEPAGDDGTYFQSFEFTAGVSLGPDNALRIAAEGADLPEAPALDEAWRPLAFSKQGPAGPAGVVFAGYGIAAPGDDEREGYDSYVHLDVAGKWVLVFRFLPEDVNSRRRQFFSRFASLRHKAMVARDHGALGLIVMTGPRGDAKSRLVPLKFDAALAGSSVSALSISDELGAALLKLASKDIEALQQELDTGDPVMGFEIPGVQIEASIDIVEEKRTGRNVLARLPAGDAPSDAPFVVVGAHIDHLGRGVGNQSLARSDEEGEIHYGADDNASGTAGLLEIAEFLAAEKAAGRFDPVEDIVFGAWSGEELGLFGSSHFVRTATNDGQRKLSETVSAFFNMDMIGRLQDRVLIHGVGSSPVWPAEVERANAPVGLPLMLQSDPYLPTDSTPFYTNGVPFVNAFTGVHDDYHRPSDTADKIDCVNAARIAELMARLVAASATTPGAPDYQAMAEPEKRDGVTLRAYLGTVPDYSQTDSPGVKLAGVASGGPADRAGLRSGDSIVELAGKKIENIYDYTYAIQALKIGEPVEVVVLRGDERLTFTITPGSRE